MESYQGQHSIIWVRDAIRKKAIYTLLTKASQKFVKPQGTEALGSWQTGAPRGDKDHIRGQRSELKGK